MNAPPLLREPPAAPPEEGIDWQRRYQDESRIVDNVWGALCISTYEQAGGRDIATIVAEWKRRAEEAEAVLARETPPREPEPNVEALMDRAGAWQATFFDDEVRRWAFTTREVEARQLIADLMLCLAHSIPAPPVAPGGDPP